MTRHTQGVIPAAKALAEYPLAERVAKIEAETAAMRARQAIKQRDFWARRDAAQGGL
jgi:hypothetical protein